MRAAVIRWKGSQAKHSLHHSSRLKLMRYVGVNERTELLQPAARTANTPMDIRRCSQVGLSDKVAQFNKQADQHRQKQTRNPFSAAEGAALDKPTLDKNDPNYGRPVAGSKTDMRGKKAHTHISKEVLQLCQIIYENGEPIEEMTEDGRNQIVISFGELFQIYTSISNKVVGVLLRARKHKFVDFEGETLFQRRDDDVPVILRKSLPEIGEIFQAQMEMIAKEGHC